jgi:hypothetical protein
MRAWFLGLVPLLLSKAEASLLFRTNLVSPLPALPVCLAFLLSSSKSEDAYRTRCRTRIRKLGIL